MKKRSAFFIGFFVVVVTMVFVNKETREEFFSVIDSLNYTAPIYKGFDMQEYSLKESADIVLDKILNYKIDELVDYVDQDWLYFSPYSYTDDLENNVLFSTWELLTAFQNSWVFFRWYRDGRWDEIILSFADYYDRFINDHNYLESSEIYTGNAVVSRGNTLVNLSSFFYYPEIIEYHIPSFDPQYEWLDWRSLYLVFVSHNWQRYLKLISHGEWTI